MFQLELVSTYGLDTYFMSRSNLFLYAKKSLGKCTKLDLSPVPC